MYNKASLKAEEFICHEEIEETLAYAEANKDNLALIDEIIAKAKLRKGLLTEKHQYCWPARMKRKSRKYMTLQNRLRKISMEIVL